MFILNYDLSVNIIDRLLQVMSKINVQLLDDLIQDYYLDKDNYYPSLLTLIEDKIVTYLIKNYIC